MLLPTLGNPTIPAWSIINKKGESCPRGGDRSRAHDKKGSAFYLCTGGDDGGALGGRMCLVLAGTFIGLTGPNFGHQ